MNEYLSSFNEIFEVVIRKYNLQVEVVDAYNICLVGGSYEIEFTIWREGVDIGYHVLISSSEILQYNIRNFIATHLTDKDRDISGFIFPAGVSVIQSRDLRDLNYLANALQNHFPSMLEGTMEWLESYEKYIWYQKPLIRKRRRRLE